MLSSFWMGMQFQAAARRVPANHYVSNSGRLHRLRSVLLQVSDHSFAALTDVHIARVELSRILPLFVDHPRLGAALLWATSRDEAITVEHLASVGRRTAIERTAHFFLELSERLRMVGLTDDGVSMPFDPI